MDNTNHGQFRPDNGVITMKENKTTYLKAAAPLPPVTNLADSLVRIDAMELDGNGPFACSCNGET